MEQQNLIYLRVKQELIRLIDNMEPHQRIPSRTELVKMFGASRTSIDRAISELIGEGYLIAKDGSGTYIAPRPEPESPARQEYTSWGLIMPNIMINTYPGILRGVEDIASENNINLIACNTDNNLDKQTRYIEKLIHSNVSGLVLVPVVGGSMHPESLKMLKESQIPFVFCNRGVSGVEAPLVTSNNYYGAYLAVKHLIASGYRRIAFLSRPMYSTVMERYHGYVAALREAGLEVNERWIHFEESFDIENPGYESTRELLQTDPAPDSIFCYVDILAKGAYEAIEDSGLNVGEDIGLVGYDDSPLCESFPVKLTSVKIDTYAIGRKAGELLISMIRGDMVQKNKLVVLDPELIVRESSRGPR